MVTRDAERSIATKGRLLRSRPRIRRAAHAAVRPESTGGAGAAAAIPHRTMHACARPVPRLPPPGGDSRPPIRAPASALRRARPPPSDGGRAPHTALRAPPWAFTQHIVSTNVLSSPGGIGILAQSPTARPEGKEGDARVGPPPHTSHRPRSWPGLPACPPLTSSTLHRQPAGVAFLPPTRPPGRMHRGPCRPR